jgi:hypothetical protein
MFVIRNLATFPVCVCCNKWVIKNSFSCILAFRNLNMTVKRYHHCHLQHHHRDHHYHSFLCVMYCTHLYGLVTNILAIWELVDAKEYSRNLLSPSFIKVRPISASCRKRLIAVPYESCFSFRLNYPLQYLSKFCIPVPLTLTIRRFRHNLGCLLNRCIIT